MHNIKKFIQDFHIHSLQTSPTLTFSRRFLFAEKNDEMCYVFPLIDVIKCNTVSYLHYDISMISISCGRIFLKRNFYKRFQKAKKQIF